jgi:hypothetical protein
MEDFQKFRKSRKKKFSRWKKFLFSCNKKKTLYTYQACFHSNVDSPCHAFILPISLHRHVECSYVTNTTKQRENYHNFLSHIFHIGKFAFRKIFWGKFFPHQHCEFQMLSLRLSFENSTRKNQKLAYDYFFSCVNFNRGNKEVKALCSV